MTRLYSVLAGLALLIAFSVAAPSEAEAHPRSGGPFGLGIILFEPTGLTGKYFIDDMMAIDFHLGLEGIDNACVNTFSILCCHALFTMFTCLADHWVL